LHINITIFSIYVLKTDSAYDLLAFDLQYSTGSRRPDDFSGRERKLCGRRSTTNSDRVAARPRGPSGGGNRFVDRETAYPSNRGRGGTSSRA